MGETYNKALLNIKSWWIAHDRTHNDSNILYIQIQVNLIKQIHLKKKKIELQINFKSKKQKNYNDEIMYNYH